MRKNLNAYQTVWRPLVLSDHGAYLQLMQSVRSAVKTGIAREDAAAADELSAHVPKYAILTRLSAPVFDGIPERLDEYEVNLQLGRLGLALEDYRSREGKYPASLPDLGLPDSAITDPFTGQTFIYRTEGDNMLVYSVGFDREDGGGVPRGADGRRDVVWRIERGSAAR